MQMLQVETLSPLESGTVTESLKIYIMGGPASGKTTLAEELAGLTGLPQ